MAVRLGDVVYRSDRTRIERVIDPGAGPCVRKEFAGPDARARLRREVAALRRLEGVAGVPELLAVLADDGALLLEDLGEEVLQQGGVREPEEVRRLAAGLAETLADVHERQVLHLDVNPSNTVLTSRGVALIDFDVSAVASGPAREVPRDVIGGTLAYMAPEQTGRTGRPVDERSDLYALGGTMYELATGRPPLTGTDSLRLIRDQLAGTHVPVQTLNPRVPDRLCAIIDRLLNKDPDLRYQSASGLAHDLRAPLTDPGPLGQGDFPARLAPPACVVGRRAEQDLVRAAFDGMLTGRLRGIMVAGPGGIGKTSLIGTLRPVVTAAGGRFVTGKYDQYRQDQSSDAVVHALRALARLLATSPDDELAAIRARLTDAGVDGASVTALVPEFGALLGDPGGIEPRSDEEARSRFVHSATAVLQAVVSHRRPLVVVLDDLQWSSAVGIDLLDAVFLGGRIDGLLIAGAYRDAEVGPTHPLFALLEKWRTAGVTPEAITLRDLPVSETATLLAEMMRMPEKPARALAEVVAAHSGGNPFEMIELINGLRRDRVLVRRPEGWAWQPEAIRAYADDRDIAGVLSARMATLPPLTRQILTVMACLGGAGTMDLLRLAVAVPAEEACRRLDPALQEGMVVRDAETGEIYFRHDRVQQAAYRRLTGRALSLTYLVIGKRLQAAGGHDTMAAQLLVHALDHLQPDRRVARLFLGAARELSMMSTAVAERYLAAAMELSGPGGDPEVEIERHRLLVRLGRHDEADAVFRSLSERAGPYDVATAAVAQITGLTVRARQPDALALGREMLLSLGVEVPRDAEMAAQTTAGLDRMFDWIGGASVEVDAARPAIAEPAGQIAAELMLRMLPAAFFGELDTMPWLVTAAQRLWTGNGPHPALVGSLGHAGIVGILTRENYAGSYAIIRHLTAVADARGWAAEAGLGRFLAAVSTAHWFEPIEDAVQLGRAAREALLRDGDMQFACATYHATVPTLLDCAGSLDDYSEEVAAAVAFGARTGNEQAAATIYTFRLFVSLMRGQPLEPGYDDAAHRSSAATNPMAMTYFHTVHGLAAAIFGDERGLASHAAAAAKGLPSIAASYSTSTVHLLRALSGASSARAWLAARAEDAPANFRHLVAFVDGDYELALEQLGTRRRPWQRALITERYARSLLKAGQAVAGRRLLADARDLYDQWGAAAKVRALWTEHPYLKKSAPNRATISMSAQTIDMMATLRASQALSSETTIAGLSARTDEVLGSLTGANRVTILLRHGDGWTTADGADAGFPGSVVRYVERVGEHLLVGDAVTDDRFAGDPHFAGLGRCSLLAVPIAAGEMNRAMLLLENTLSSEAFTDERLDVVKLVAGQLAVSLGNIRLYAELENRVAERTEALSEANRRLEEMSRTDPLTGLPNRRELDRALEYAWRQGRPVAVAMIDVDHFKLYNDHYGHLAGDEVLRRLASALREGLGATDLAARYGGEEFTLVLPGATEATARTAGERALRACFDLGLEHVGNPPGRVTVSVGVACLNPSASTGPAALLQAADEQLYRAKLSGRNRVAAF